MARCARISSHRRPVERAPAQLDREPGLGALQPPYRRSWRACPARGAGVPAGGRPPRSRSQHVQFAGVISSGSSQGGQLRGVVVGLPVVRPAHQQQDQQQRRQALEQQHREQRQRAVAEAVAEQRRVPQHVRGPGAEHGEHGDPEPDPPRDDRGARPDSRCRRRPARRTGCGSRRRRGSRAAGTSPPPAARGRPGRPARPRRPRRRCSRRSGSPARPARRRRRRRARCSPARGRSARSPRRRASWRSPPPSGRPAPHPSRRPGAGEPSLATRFSRAALAGMDTAVATRPPQAKATTRSWSARAPESPARRRTARTARRRARTAPPRSTVAIGYAAAKRRPISPTRTAPAASSARTTQKRAAGRP